MPENLLTPSYGLTNGKLELANATAAQVMSGRTFYAGNKELKTGTLSLTGNASTGDVKSGKTFYSNSFTRQSGTLSLSGNATTSDVASGKTFYSNSFTRQTGIFTGGNMYLIQSGTFSDDYSLDINVKTLLPSNYSSLTADSFYLVPTTMRLYQVDSNIHRFDTACGVQSYNASTGILTVKPAGNAFNSEIGIRNYKLYAFY